MSIYNNFDPSKNYTSISFEAGNHLQSAELNEMQSILNHQNSSVTKFLVNNGTIISGGAIIQLTNNVLVMGSAVVSYNGRGVHVTGGSIDLIGIPEAIGIKVSTRVVTSEDDEALLQPDPSSPYYMTASSNRTRVEGEWIKQSQATDGDVFVSVLSVSMGSVVGYSANQGSYKDYTTSSISKYDRTIHGSYCISGLELRYRDDLVASSAGYVPMELGSGTARVNGNEVNVSSALQFSLDPITSDFQEVSAEPITFTKGTTSYILRKLPLKSITRIIGTKQATSDVNRGAAAGTTDLLPKTPVLRVLEVKVGGTTYRQGTDFTQIGDSISWALPGAEPAPGTLYTVSYQYQDTFDGLVTSNRLQIKSADTSALVDQTQLSVTYDFYLSRIDRLVLTDNGDYKIYKGVPNTVANLLPPPNAENHELSIALIRLSYGGSPQIDQDDTVFMVPFKTMKKMSDDIVDIKYNLLQMSLKDDAREMSPVTNKRNIVVDSLSNNNMRDMGILKYNNAVIDNSVLTIGSSFTNTISLSNTPIVLGYKTEATYMNQLTKTGSQRINPYARPNTSPTGQMALSPSVVFGNMWEAGYEGETLPRDFVIKCSVSEFSNSEQVRVEYRGKIVGNISTDASGTGSINIPIESGTPYSTYEIKAVGLVSGALAVSTFVIRRNLDTYSLWQRQRSDSLQAEAEVRLRQEITDLESQLTAELSVITSRLTGLEEEVSLLTTSMTQLSTSVKAEFTKIGNSINDIKIVAKVNADQIVALQKADQLTNSQLADLRAADAATNKTLEDLKKANVLTAAQIADLQRIDKLTAAELQALKTAGQLTDLQIIELKKKSAAQDRVISDLQTVDKLTAKQIEELQRRDKITATEISDLKAINKMTASQLAAMDASIQEISNRITPHYIHYYSNDRNLTTPSQFTRIFRATEYSSGAISYNQGSSSLAPGSQLWEMGILAKSAINKTISIHQNDDSMYVYLNGKLVYNRGMSGATTSYALNLRKGSNLLQVIVNNKGKNLSHLQTTGDVIDGSITTIDATWVKSSIDAAEKELIRQKEEKERLAKEAAARAAEQERQRQSRLLSRRKTDPVAQSFETDAPVNISAVTVEVTELPTKDLTCKLVEVTAGQPDITKLVGFGRVPLASVKIGMNKIPLEVASQLQADKEYAFIIITESYEGKIAIAKVGDKDDTGNFLKYQTHTGVMFLSANENTWTAVQDSDVKFILHKVDYLSTRTIQLATLKAVDRVEDLTDFRLVGNVAIPASTDIKFFMKINNVNYDLVLNKTVSVPAVKKSRGDITIFAKLDTTNPTFTPTIQEGVMFLAGKSMNPSYYTTRQFEIRDGLITPAKIQIYLDQLLDTGTSLEVHYQSGATDEDWTLIPRKTNNDRDLGNNWVETMYEISSVSRSHTRIRIKLNTTHHDNRPQVKNIRILTV